MTAAPDDSAELRALLGEVRNLLRNFLEQNQSPWLTTEEAGDYVKASARTLEGYRASGGGPVYHRRIGNNVHYHRGDLDSWLREGRALHTPGERLAGRL